MSFSNPANRITRWSVVGMEGMWTKMWDPPTTSPQATDQLLPVQQGLIRPNPVPEVMFAAGLQSKPSKPHTVQRDLLHGLSIPTWDCLKKLNFFVIGDPDNPTASGGTYPGPTLRMPRSVIFNAETSGKGPPPHTIHWHGIEPTPLNDGVGHCSMELGHYTYQWQPNFMGFYFLHCHRNTMQHFEFGLFSAMIFEAPDSYFASIASTDPVTGNVTLNNIPIGHGRDGKRRCACNLDDPLTGLPKFTQFPGFNRNPVNSPDPGPGPTDTQISFASDPHAMTVPFDVEALLVCDDRDSVWSDLAPSAFTTFPKHGSMPGINDQFTLNPGKNGFFAFNDYNADYWFITGVPVPAHKGGTGTIPANVVIPAELNSGISGTQISINAQVNQTILVRLLCAAYNTLRTTFPVDVVVIAWDGRALGVAPFGHNNSYLVPAGTPIEQTVARRFDALIRTATPINGNIKIEFINNKSQVPGDLAGEEVVMTALVPMTISASGLIPITAAAAPGGTITPSGATGVPSGTSQTYTITPNPGFSVSALVVDGTELPGATTFTFTNVTAAHYINAYFAPSGLTITAAAGAGGTITPAGATAVTPGTSPTYTITPNAGFLVSALVVDGVELPGATTFTFTNVTGNHYINAYFASATAGFTITAAAAANGSISPAGPTAVTAGSNQTYTITPNAGHTVAALVVDGVELPGATTYTFSNVTGNHYINAYFL